MIPKWYHIAMKLITRNTDYAVRAACYLAKHEGGAVPASRLVADLGMPRPFLRKIMQSLTRAGLVRSYRGAGGGFVLAVNPSKLRISKIIGVFQGPFRLNECLFRKRICPDRRVCPLRKRIGAIEAAAVAEIGGITIGSLIKEAK
jgi:Rrf2 family protein